MGGLFLISLLMLAGVADGEAAPPPPQPAAADDGVVRNRLFVSPMGEPFRTGSGEAAPQDVWFNQVDVNHDGVLSRDEFVKDALRFFQRLDRQHDGEIDPDDIEYYELTMLPEIRVDSTWSSTIEAGGDDDGGGSSSTPVGLGRRGAARYSYFDYPEPVMVADTNFNRGVDVREFLIAADKRFALLDVNHDGKIEKSELPRLTLTKSDLAPKGKRRR